MANFNLSHESRVSLFKKTFDQLEEVYDTPRSLDVAPQFSPEEVKSYVKSLSLDGLESPEQVIDSIITGLKKYAVHTHHPGYFGLFNPRPNFMSTLGDYITAVMNPQMAAWSHAAFANEVERHLVEAFGQRFGFKTPDGTFCGGGAESNLTAVQCALNHYFPEVLKEGALAIKTRPVIYCSTESHHSIVKAARTVGIGSDSVKSIPVDANLEMNLDALKEQIRKDQSVSHLPIMVVATAGTTGSGAIDPIDEIADICKESDMWLHVDGAYGAAVIVSQKHKELLKGIHRADSITMDFHKWFSVPMAGSVFITSNPHILFQTYNIHTDYMPPDGDQKEMVDPYLHSIQWSRRFTGLKMYISVLTHGWQGYEQMIDRDIEMGNKLRQLLLESGWEIKNNAVIPVLCFAHPSLDHNDHLVRQLVDAVVASGKSWVSVYPIHGRATIRACVSNYATTEEDLKVLVDGLDEALNQL